MESVDTIRISVCVATYNGSRYIREQLESVLAQLGTEDEVVVSDDGSTDDTLEIVRGLQDARIRIVHSNAHYFKWNFQHAMQHARGQVIFLADQDDVWMPGKVDACMEALEQVDLVCTNSMLCDAELNVINPDFFSVYHSGPGILKNSLNNTYYGSCMAFRRWVMEAALPLPSTPEIGHDIWLGLVAEMLGRVRFLPQPYLLYRRHGDTFSSTSSLLHRSKRKLWTKIGSRFVVLAHVVKYTFNHIKKNK